MKKFVLTTISITIYLSLTAQYFSSQKTFSEIVDFTLCGGTIIFEPTGYFFLERGCEGDGRAAYGIYKIDKNIIRLKYYSFDSLQLINRIEYTPEINRDSTIKVVMFDRYYDSITPFRIDYVYGQNKRVDYFFEKVMELPVNGVFSFPNLNQLFKIKNKDSIIQIPTTNHDMKIYFNVPGYYLYYNLYEELPDDGKPQKLYIKKDGLYTNRKTRLFKP